jgi:hypothetical protein
LIEELKNVYTDVTINLRVLQDSSKATTLHLSSSSLSTF